MQLAHLGSKGRSDSYLVNVPDQEWPKAYIAVTYGYWEWPSYCEWILPTPQSNF